MWNTTTHNTFGGFRTQIQRKFYCRFCWDEKSLWKLWWIFWIFRGFWAILFNKNRLIWSGFGSRIVQHNNLLGICWGFLVNGRISGYQFLLFQWLEFYWTLCRYLSVGAFSCIEGEIEWWAGKPLLSLGHRVFTNIYLFSENRDFLPTEFSNWAPEFLFRRWFNYFDPFYSGISWNLPVFNCMVVFTGEEKNMRCWTVACFEKRIFFYFMFCVDFLIFLLQI